jgi:hypothetical protein
MQGTEFQKTLNPTADEMIIGVVLTPINIAAHVYGLVSISKPTFRKQFVGDSQCHTKAFYIKIGWRNSLNAKV